MRNNTIRELSASELDMVGGGLGVTGIGGIIKGIDKAIGGVVSGVEGIIKTVAKAFGSLF